MRDTGLDHDNTDGRISNPTTGGPAAVPWWVAAAVACGLAVGGLLLGCLLAAGGT